MRVFSFILSSLIFLQSFQISFEDLIQLDELIEHAKFHKIEHGDNLFVFLSKHYGVEKAMHSDSHPEEQQEHEELPFQCQNHLLTLPAFVLNQVVFNSNLLLEEEDLKGAFFYQFSHSKLYASGILQPPQFT